MNRRIHWYSALLLCAIAVLGGGCLGSASRLRRELLEFVGQIPHPPNSVLLSEGADRTTGASTRCDGQIVSRLYGTDDPIEAVIGYVEEVCFELDESAVREGFYPEWILSIRFPHGYGLGVTQVQLTPELLRDPFFMHEDVAEDQPYETIFQLNVVHYDPDLREYCLMNE